MKAKKRIRLSTTHIIMLSFLITVSLGALLLALPVSSADGVAIPFVDAVFTATTATCVTGLVVIPTFSSFSTFGHIVILLLIQVGGLGVITVISGIALSFHKNMGLSDRVLIQDAFNINTLSGVSSLVKKVIIGTLIVESVGALLYMLVFVPEFGVRGIWISIFNSISAFCNAGIDIIGNDSLYSYATDPLVNSVTSALIILGGLGYIVWWDIIRVLRRRISGMRGAFKGLTLHSKIVLSVTVSLILIGALSIFAFEYNNPETIGNYGLFDKIQMSFFQSVTTRTAGFASLPQEKLTDPSALVSMLLMLIGGSPVGTAGGIKTVTFAVLVISAASSISGKNRINAFGRSISSLAVKKALAVFATSFAIMFVSTVALSVVTDASMLDVLYEAVSATATVGLTRNLTPYLDTAGKIIVIATMYLGRVGPISLAVAFTFKKKVQNIIKDPTEEISVG